MDLIDDCYKKKEIKSESEESPVEGFHDDNLWVDLSFELHNLLRLALGDFNIQFHWAHFLERSFSLLQELDQPLQRESSVLISGYSSNLKMKNLHLVFHETPKLSS
jgi:hypothetical protein